jgi:heat shock protein HtpX
MDFRKNIAQNRVKTLAFIFLTFVFLGAIIFAISYLFISRNYVDSLVISLSIGTIVIFILYLNSSNITLHLAKADKIDPSKNKVLYDLVEEVAIAAGIRQMPKIYVIQDLAMNAFACGTVKNGNIVFTAGILQQLNRDELQGVAAHEMSHLKNGDSKLMTIVAGVGMAIGIVAQLGTYMMWFGGGRRDSKNSNDSGLLGIILLVVSLAALILSPFLAAITQAAISRKREWMADDSAVSIMRNPTGLRSALQKLGNGVTKPQNASQNISHLWIANPVPGNINVDESGEVEYKRAKPAKSMFDTHPPLEERIKHLKKLEGLG